MISRIPINVECYAGGHAREVPRALHLEGRRLEVADVLDRWYQGGVDPTSVRVEYFKVRTETGSELVVRYEPDAHAWYLVSELE